jgi:hypothetical protein
MLCHNTGLYAEYRYAECCYDECHDKTLIFVTLMNKVRLIVSQRTNNITLFISVITFNDSNGQSCIISRLRY